MIAPGENVNEGHIIYERYEEDSNRDIRVFAARWLRVVHM